MPPVAYTLRSKSALSSTHWYPLQLLPLNHPRCFILLMNSSMAIRPQINTLVRGVPPYTLDDGPIFRWCLTPPETPHKKKQFRYFKTVGRKVEKPIQPRINILKFISRSYTYGVPFPLRQYYRMLFFNMFDQLPYILCFWGGCLTPLETPLLYCGFEDIFSTIDISVSHPP